MVKPDLLCDQCLAARSLGPLRTTRRFDVEPAGSREFGEARNASRRWRNRESDRASAIAAATI